MTTIPPTNPYHIARAYAQANALASAERSLTGATPAGREGAAGVRRGDDVSFARSLGGSSGAAGAGGAAGVSKTAANAAPLVAAQVPGRVDFSGDTPTQVRGLARGSASVDAPSNSVRAAYAPSEASRADVSVFPLYRRPTDKNEVATALAVGRSLDVQG
jgi:hypothetical protein